MSTLAPYDAIAAVYDRYWGSAFASHARKAVERHLAGRLPRHAAILDLCCGSGLLLRELDALGYECFGVDESAGMLEIAGRNAPDAVLQRADMAAFQWDHTFDAAICLYNSLNHARSATHLLTTLKQVRLHLRPGGLFLFDYILPTAFASRWESTEEIEMDGRSERVRYELCPERGVASCLIGGLQAIDLVPFETSEFRTAVHDAGLTRLQEIPATGMDPARGRRLMLTLRP